MIANTGTYVETLSNFNHGYAKKLFENRLPEHSP
jgi:hypothetical protein